jgi:hypothetical protein
MRRMSRLSAPMAVFVHPGWDTDRTYLLRKTTSLDEARRGCDATNKRLAAHRIKLSDYEVRKMSGRTTQGPQCASPVIHDFAGGIEPPDWYWGNHRPTVAIEIRKSWTTPCWTA